MTTETRIIENLIALGWSRESASGVFCCLQADQPLNICGWEGSHRSQFHDWASANERNPFSLEGQIAYLDYTLRNNYEGIGKALRAAKTQEEAREAFMPYMGVRFLTLDEAKATGYVDPGNAELNTGNS